MAKHCPHYPTKRRFHDKREAMNALHRMTNSTAAKVPSRSYYCDGCKGYHLTSAPDKFARQVA